MAGEPGQLIKKWCFGSRRKSAGWGIVYLMAVAIMAVEFAHLRRSWIHPQAIAPEC
jgi:hypothetical protein